MDLTFWWIIGLEVLEVIRNSKGSELERLVVVVRDLKVEMMESLQALPTANSRLKRMAIGVSS